MEEPKDPLEKSPFYSNSKYLLNFPKTFETVDQLLRALERIDILNLNSTDEFLAMDSERQREVVICIHSVTRDMIVTRWDPLSEFVCFNEKALAEFQAKLPLFKAIVDLPITSKLVKPLGLSIEKQALKDFEDGRDYHLTTRYPITDIEKWN
ncbi:MAG: hypothetical protein ABIM99_03725 [Candidatus Dojkabacteria bacterium]